MRHDFRPVGGAMRPHFKPGAYAKLTAETLINRADIAQVAGVKPRTPLAWVDLDDFPEAVYLDGRPGRWWHYGEVRAWLIETGRLTADNEDPWLNPSQVAELFGIEVVTLRGWRWRDEFPPPEHHHGRTPLWRTSTVSALLRDIKTP